MSERDAAGAAGAGSVKVERAVPRRAYGIYRGFHKLAPGCKPHTTSLLLTAARPRRLPAPCPPPCLHAGPACAAGSKSSGSKAAGAFWTLDGQRVKARLETPGRKVAVGRVEVKLPKATHGTKLGVTHKLCVHVPGEVGRRILGWGRRASSGLLRGTE
jgi:hypothetical protein